MAQVREFFPPPPKPGYPAPGWQAGLPLLMGATLRRPGPGPVRIWLRGEEAHWRGALFLVDPVTRRDIFLFENRNYGAVGKVDISRHIPVGATVYFKYEIRSLEIGRHIGPADPSWLPKYTGADGPESPYHNRAGSGANPDPAHRFGHVWSVAGVVNDSTMEFGFEDDASALSDMDFDDVVFQVEGLAVQAPRRVLRRSFVW